MRKHMSWLIVLSVLLMSATLMAQERRRYEFSLAGGTLSYGEAYSTIVGGSFGYYTKYVGAEVNAVVYGLIGVFGANVVVGLFDSKRIVPYVLGGAWTSLYGGIGFYVGGGLKYKITDRYGFRAEYRRYIVGETRWGVEDSFMAGFSIFF